MYELPAQISGDVPPTTATPEYSEDERKFLIPLLMQKNLMLLMIPEELSKDATLDFSDDSRLKNALLERWAKKYGEAFRHFITTMPRGTAAENQFAERIDSGRPTDEDYSVLKQKVEEAVRPGTAGEIDQGGPFFSDETEIQTLLASVQTSH